MCELAIKTEREHHAWRLLPPLTVPRSANGSGVRGEGASVQVRVGHECLSFQCRLKEDLYDISSFSLQKKL